MSLFEEQGKRVFQGAGFTGVTDGFARLRESLAIRRMRPPAADAYARTSHLRRDLGLADAPPDHPPVACRPFV